MSWKIIFIFVLIALIPYIYAIDPLINEEYFTGDIIILNNTPYIVLGSDSSGDYLNNYSSVVFKNNKTKEVFKVSIGKCKDINHYIFCYEDNYYNWDNNKTWIGNRLEPSLKIKIYYNKPEIKLTREKSIELEYGKSNIINISFENTGSKKTIIYYEEKIPDNFVVNCDFCINNNVLLKTYLNPNEKKEFNYYITPFTYENHSWSYKLYYTSYDKNISLNETISIKISKPHVITESIPKNNLVLDEQTTYKINISNTIDSALKINLSIHSSLIKAYNGLLFNGKNYFFEGIIPAKDSKIFEVTLIGSNIGYHHLIVNATITSFNKNFYYNTNYSINVSLKPIVASFIVDKESVNPGENVFVIAKLENTDENEGYLNVYSYLSWIDDYNYIPYISAKKEFILYNGTIKAPVDEDLYLTIKGIYRTRNLQELSFSAIKVIDVIGVESKIERINHTINTNTINTNNNYTANNTNNTLVYNTNINTNMNNTDYAINNNDINETFFNESKDYNKENTVLSEKNNFISRFIKSFDSFIKKLFGR